LSSEEIFVHHHGASAIGKGDPYNKYNTHPNDMAIPVNSPVYPHRGVAVDFSKLLKLSHWYLLQKFTMSTVSPDLDLSFGSRTHDTLSRFVKYFLSNVNYATW